MVVGRWAAHHRLMTTDQTASATDPPPNGDAAATRLLRRRRDDRIVGGVAAGIADYLDVDPVLIRALFVGLMIFGGAGFVLYALGWLLIPAEDQDHSPAESFVRGLDLSPRTLVFALFVLIGLTIVGVSLASPTRYDPFDSGFYVDGRAVLLLAAIGAGIWILRRTARPTVAPGVAAAPGADVTVATSSSRPRVRRATRPVEPRSPLALYIVAAALIMVGVLALAGNVADVRIAPGQFFGLAYLVLGAGLVIGAWWGRARMLILSALLLLPFAVAAAFVTAPIEGGVGDQRHTPASIAEVRDAYRLAGGRLVLDLRELPGNDPVDVVASVAVGELVVWLPEDADASVDASVGAGATWLFGTVQSGTSLDEQTARGAGREFALDLEAGIGQITVDIVPEVGS